MYLLTKPKIQQKLQVRFDPGSDYFPEMELLSVDFQFCFLNVQSSPRTHGLTRQLPQFRLHHLVTYVPRRKGSMLPL